MLHALDEIDRKIIRILGDDARRSLADIGRQVGLSTPAVHRRVRALEASRLIAGYTIRVDPAVFSAGLQAIVALDLAGGAGSLDRIANAVADLREVEACWSTAGTSDMLLRVRAAGPQELERLLIRLGSLAGVGRTRTTVLLVTHFDRPPDPSGIGPPEGVRAGAAAR